MTTLQDSILTGDFHDVRLREHIKTCQALVGSEWSEGTARDIWTRVVRLLQAWRRSVEPFKRAFNGVDTSNDVHILSRLVQLKRSPIGDMGASARVKILALGVLQSAARGDIEGALLLLVDLKDEQRLTILDEARAHTVAVRESLQQQTEKLLELAPDFKLGKKRRAQLKHFSEMANGPPEERDALLATYQSTSDELRKAHPGWPKSEIYRAIAAKHDLHPDSVKRLAQKKQITVAPTQKK